MISWVQENKKKKFRHVESATLCEDFSNPGLRPES